MTKTNDVDRCFEAEYFQGVQSFCAQTFQERILEELKEGYNQKFPFFSKTCSSETFFYRWRNLFLM